MSKQSAAGGVKIPFVAKIKKLSAGTKKAVSFLGHIGAIAAVYTAWSDGGLTFSIVGDSIHNFGKYLVIAGHYAQDWGRSISNGLGGIDNFIAGL